MNTTYVFIYLLFVINATPAEPGPIFSGQQTKKRITQIIIQMRTRIHIYIYIYIYMYIIIMLLLILL